uniref:Thiamine pyrimidine synthase n=1 Tax=Candidatus Kentrum sp. SD TaxID=2126332 RepID=A0A450YK02_9GAMM|nr:MAG: ABC-type nitrate/sulfonate/bicarbonate transport system, substrate-binding protein [Candidatus Kentron sp. SD]VFK47777.1 MAG: ABC-type nitrate/sulfonate/bicarbonate transport system, substrate-binding protein [Candidatus Kentron sp. SD]
MISRNKLTDPNRRVKLSIWLLLSFLAVMFVVSCDNKTSPESLDKISVRFPIPIVEAGQTTFYVAQDKGFYAEEGLDVQFEMGSKELNPVKMVASRQDDFAILGGPDTLLVARSKGHPLKAIAVIHRNSNFPCLITLKSSGITKLDQLQDKQIGFFYGHISTDVLRNLLRRNGIKYTEVDVGFDYAQLIAGRIDAEWAFTVTAGLELPAKGVDINFISPADYGINTHGYTIFATEKTIRERTDLTLRFLRASLKGVKYTLDNPEYALKSLLKRAPNLDEELNLKRQLAYNEVTSNTDKFPLGYMDETMFQATYDRLVEEDVIEKPFDIESAYTVEFLEKIHGKAFR